MTNVKANRRAGGRQRAAPAVLAGATVLFVTFGGTREASALQGGEDPATLPVLLDKRFGQAGRHQASILFSTAMVTKLIEAVGAYATYQYSFTDWLGAGFSAGAFLGGETSITDAIRLVENPDNPGGEAPLGDLHQMFWMASIDVAVVPLYGKISFLSEFDPSFDVFVLAGLGAGQVRRDRAPAGGPVVTTDTAFTPIFSLGFGLRLYLTDLVGLRFEVRDFFYPEPEKGVGGLTFNLHFQGGVQLTF